MNHKLLLYDFDQLNEALGQGDEPSKVQLDANRQAYLEYLYDRDGRHDPAHPMHSLWTGLAVARREELALALLDRVGQGLIDVEVENLHRDERYAPYFERGASHVSVHPGGSAGDDPGGDAGEPLLEGHPAAPAAG